MEAQIFWDVTLRFNKEIKQFCISTQKVLNCSTIYMDEIHNDAYCYKK